MKSGPPVSKTIRHIEDDIESAPQPATQSSRWGAIVFAGTFFVLLLLLVVAEALRG